MRLLRIPEPIDHPDYLYDVKHDGLCALVYLEGDRGGLTAVLHFVRMLPNGNDGAYPKSLVERRPRS